MPSAEIRNPPPQQIAATTPALRGPSRSTHGPKIAADDPSTTKNRVYIHPSVLIDTSADALGVCVDVEALAACKADERHAGVAREVYRETGRRRHGGDDRNAGKDGLLDDLVRGPAADAEQMVR